MISSELALALREAGLIWHPRAGDRFRLNLAEFDAEVFTVSEMTIEARNYPTGSILAFNGTTEWALDSVAQEDTLWLPSEEQLRELLRGTFRSLHRLPETYRVEIKLQHSDETSETLAFERPEPSDAYALALLELLRRLA